MKRLSGPTSPLSMCTLLACLALAATACKGTPAPVATGEVDASGPIAHLESKSCPGGVTGEGGLGKPCAHVADCQGQAAITCLKENEPDGFDFCTKYCFGIKSDECGAGGKCISRGKLPSVCAPVACADKLAVPLPKEVTIAYPCTSGKVNDFGVGKACATHDDCAEFKVAKTCPRAIRPENPPWCSMLCSEDSECGENAFCWRRTTEENGRKFVIGSCAPVACQAKAAP